jgi:hypothetical protein
MALLVWASPAAADEGSGRSTRPDNSSFLFDKEAFGIKGLQAEAGGAEGFSRLSVRLYGGLSYIGAGDINTGSRGFFDLLELYAAYGVGTFTGEYSSLHGGFDAGVDIVYQITPNIGLGLGAGFIRCTRGSAGVYSDEGQDAAVTAAPAISAIPIRLGAFLTFPASPTLDFTAEVGGAYYAGLEFDLEQRLEFGPNDWVEFLYSGGEAGSSNLGFHGALGLEYEITAKTGIFVQAVGRYAMLGNFKTAWEIMNDGGGNSNTSDGVLYIRTESDPDFTFSEFTVRETPPVDDADTTYREPKFDLSGFSLQVGFRFRF